ncbi:ricin B-like lectin EULS3 [Tripterygium wilfordii]|uniref:ricin B-like lectin EULS3 n=1 Tax=Tripterygium wilfordii TaxID=458696 RepID=UPI0018F83B0D|nr:ricin B-like lectin EULS3 [Tripterygium wilfordii]
MATFRIFTLANPNLSMSIRNDKVILATTNPNDPNQEWYKYEKYVQGEMDKMYYKAFALVSKGTSQAIKHTTGHVQHVELVHFNPNYVDNSLLWIKGADFVEGNSPIWSIWMLNNLDLVLAAEATNTKVFDWTLIKMLKWNDEVNQLWSTVC